MKAFFQKIIVLIFLAVGIYIIYQRIHATSFNSIQDLLNRANTYYLLFITLLLIPVNWFFDSLIWHYLSFPFRGKRLWVSIVENLQSQGLGWLTPASLGEYYSKGKEFSSLKSGLWMTLFYRWSKLFGKIFLALVATSLLPLTLEVKITFSLAGLFMSILFLFPNKSLWLLTRIKRLKVLLPKVDFPKNLERVHWQKVLGSSIAKSLIFVLQFSVLASLFSNEPISILLLYSAVFFGLSGLIPTAGWADPIIKSGVGLLFFPQNVLTTEGVLIVTTTLWLLNMVLPTLPSLLKKGIATLLR